MCIKHKTNVATAIVTILLGILFFYLRVLCFVMFYNTYIFEAIASNTLLYV